MNLSNHTLSDLFAQLGLPDSTADIEAFIAAHRPLMGSARLSDASFWTDTQARFLHDEIVGDADWAEVIDQLNLLLHE